jgi:glutamate-1-semialdehyde 2,1-aminomutase
MGERARPTLYKQSLGIPEAIRDLVIAIPWNDPEMLGEVLRERGEEIACVLIEPMLGNCTALTPGPGYLQFVREQCDQYGIMLVFDEVKTGFRIAAGGAREYFGVMPDLSTYAKAMGNGYPIAAIGGPREIMMTIQPGKVAQGGTYTGNVVGTAAADATLEYMQSGKVFPALNRVGTILMQGIDEVLDRHDIPHFMHGVPGMFGFSIGQQKPRDFRDLKELCDWEMYEAIAFHLIENGVMPDPDGLEPWFLCSDHSEEDAAETLQKFEDAVRDVKVRHSAIHSAGS